MFRKVYLLTKLGLVSGNAIVALGGFFLASRGTIDFGLMAAMVFGLSMIMASACVINNYIDRDIDKKMMRTKIRPLVTNSISVTTAILVAILLAFGGGALLAVYTNYLTLGVAIFGGFAYLVLYSWVKRTSVHGTVVGALSGAVPPVVGYTAVTHTLDIGAFFLFLILVLWQVPHFYSIAIFRFEDYKSANLPVLPVVKGIGATKAQIILYILAFILATPSLFVFGLTGYTYLIVMGVVGLVWLGLGIRGLRTDNVLWARKMFWFSLIVLMVFSGIISVAPILP